MYAGNSSTLLELKSNKSLTPCASMAASLETWSLDIGEKDLIKAVIARFFSNRLKNLKRVSDLQ
jgi:hypothetical protein